MLSVHLASERVGMDVCSRGQRARVVSPQRRKSGKRRFLGDAIYGLTVAETTALPASQATAVVAVANLHLD